MMFRYFVGLIIICLLPGISAAQRTVGLLKTEDPNADGYVLFAPISSTTTWLIDKCGLEVHQWTSAYRPGQSVYLLEDGSLLRTGNAANTSFLQGGRGGIIEKLDWNSNIIWSYTISSTTECQHHDICPLPNGNVLAIVWELKSVAEAIAEGRNPALLGNKLWSEKIVEVQPTGPTTGTIVWEWHLWDHLVQDFDSTKNGYGVVDQHPELINVNYNAGNAFDWIHMNALDYNPITDQIILSNHAFSEIFIIDHSTTTVEASGHSGGNSGHGGDLLYRWGNPETYNRGVGTDQKLFGQHNVQWIESGFPQEGKIIVFNNGVGRIGGSYSSIDIIQPPVDSLGNYSIGTTTPFLPDTLDWTYVAPVPADFFGMNISGVNPLNNGGYMICEGPSGNFFEIDSLKNTVWQYINPVQGNVFMSQGTVPSQNSVFRNGFYPSTYSGFNGQTLIAGDELELNPLLPSLCDSLLSVGVSELNPTSKMFVYPNPTEDFINVTSNEVIMEINCYSIDGRMIFGDKRIGVDHAQIDVRQLKSGMYILAINSTSRYYFVKE